jgi:hypothetical protein
MKIISRFFDPESFKTKALGMNYTDFSLFVDDIPKTQQDLSPVNIMVLCEPNGYFGLHDWIIQHKDLFSIILTWDDKVLNNCSNAVFLPFGQTWFKPEQYKPLKYKKFELAHLCGILNKTYGHSMRHEILAREKEFKIPTNFYSTIGNRHDEDDARMGKETVFGNSMFGIAIENFSHRGYFSEKIIDCFLMRTIPLYWGCSNIQDYFHKSGFFKFENIDDLIFISNNLTSEIYESKKEIIENNYQIALKYINYEQSIINKLKEIFDLNSL